MLCRANLDKGCNTDPALTALKERTRTWSQGDLHQDPRRWRQCRRGRERQSARPAPCRETRGGRRLGYSFLKENSERVRSVPYQQRLPTAATIADFTYPGARPLYIYAKGAHLAAKPALRDFVAAYAKAWGKGGPLEQRGLVPLGGADAAGAGKQATELKPLDPARPEVSDARQAT